MNFKVSELEREPIDFDLELAPGAVDLGEEATQEACSAHSTGEGGNAHDRSLPGSGSGEGNGSLRGERTDRMGALSFDPSG